MATDAKSPTSDLPNKLFDRFKWLMVMAIVVIGIWGNWYFEEVSVLIRAVVLLGMAALAALVLLQTERGRNLWILLREARTEVRRVIWPGRTETVSTTAIVIALILLVSLILWALDSALSWGVSSAIG